MYIAKSYRQYNFAPYSFKISIFLLNSVMWTETWGLPDKATELA